MPLCVVRRLFVPAALCFPALSVFGRKGIEMIVKYRDPFLKRPVEVDIPDDTPPELVKEVLDFMDEDYRRYRALEERERRHRAFSLDALEYEGVSVACTETPEQEMIREEALQKRERMLSTLTETQRRRFEMVEDGMSLRHIAEIEGADLSSVAESVRAARKKLRKLL